MSGSKFQTGNIIEVSYYTNPESYEAFNSTVLILKVDTLLDLIVINLNNYDIFTIRQENIINYNKLCNIDNILPIIRKVFKNTQNKDYWLGIEYTTDTVDIKLLINLVNKTIDYYDSTNNDWFVLNESYYNILKNSIVIELDKYDVNFKYNYKTKKVYIKEKGNKKFDIYDKYLLGKENDFVFNEDNELKLITNY